MMTEQERIDAVVKFFADWQRCGTEISNAQHFCVDLNKAMFESVINSDDRRAGGMHYTSVANIHKVIDPLFMDDLHEEFQSINREHKSDRIDALRKLHDKLSSLTFLDPACGSGNFLTETYISLRRLENDILRELMKYDCKLPLVPVKVSTAQFYGIEINAFAIAVAQVALRIAENQMLQDTETIVGRKINILPQNYANIIRANALRVDWSDVVPRDKLTYIIGNPPFVGKSFQTKEQKSDMALVFNGVKGYGKLDYVACWYKKAVDFIADTQIRVAFISTDSICQGEQVAVIWKPLLKNAHIDFAHRSFKWVGESNGTATVHCVIIGISESYQGKRYIFDGNRKILAQNINPYLLDAANIFIESRTKPLCNVPQMINGGKPVEGGNLIIESEDYGDFVKREPSAGKYIRRLIGAEEFIHGKTRYCLWLVGVSLDEIIKMPLVAERVEKVIRFRLSGKKAATLKDANRPNEFQEIRLPTTDYIAVPEISSGSRQYIPIGFVDKSVIATNSLKMIPNATIYDFGVLTSRVHMAWMRAVCGRLGMGCNYSIHVVYNNFVWCNPDGDQRVKIESTAQNILDVRSRYGKRSLAWMYDEATMPSDLRDAHNANDTAVMEAYGFRADMSEGEVVAELMRMYREMVNVC